MPNKTLNALRLEKHQIKEQLKQLQSKISTGIRNTRKHQSDAKKVTELTLQLSQIELEISEKRQRLHKLKSAQIDIQTSPLVASMFKTPPPHITGKAPEASEVNITFTEEQLNSLEKTSAEAQQVTSYYRARHRGAWAVSIRTKIYSNNQFESWSNFTVSI